MRKGHRIPKDQMMKEINGKSMVTLDLDYTGEGDDVMLALKVNGCWYWMGVKDTYKEVKE